MEDHPVVRSLIREVSMKLKLSNLSALLSYHYFSILSQFKLQGKRIFQFNIEVSAAFYLSSKLNEEIRKIRDIVNVVGECLFLRSKLTLQENFINYDKSSTRFLDPSFTIQDYTKAREEVIKSERILLRLINYDLTLPLKLRSCFSLTSQLSHSLKIPPTVLQIAWSLLNDAIMSHNYKQDQLDLYPPASLYLALEFYSHSLNQFDQIAEVARERKQALLELGAESKLKLKEFDKGRTSSCAPSIKDLEIVKESEEYRKMICERVKGEGLEVVDTMVKIYELKQ